MYLIVGLGNPEADYDKTRHNMGFHVINALAKEYDISVTRKKFNSEYEVATIENQKVILVKPQTFMNASGEAVIEFVNFYKIELEKLIVIYDDIDIIPGKIRIRKSGSPGSHNGMKSVIKYLNNEKFPRVRVGIGKPDNTENLIEYVIGGIDEDSKPDLEKGVKLAKEAVIEIIKNGIDMAMNQFN